MKIEIGESLGYSYLRHVKRCWLVQTNWKPSEQWAKKGRTNDQLEQEFREMRRRFDPEGVVFKGTKDSGQFLKQAEIDVMGVDQNGGIHAMEVAFHEAGLNYLGGADNRVLKKLLRTKLVIDAYHPAKTKRDIYFVSPKVHRGVQQPLEDILQQLREAYQNVTWHLVTNQKFVGEILEPTLKRTESVADTSELFARSAKLLKLSEDQKTIRALRPQTRISARRMARASNLESGRNVPVGGLQDIVKRLMQTMLVDYPDLLNEQQMGGLLSPEYCRDVLNLETGGFALLRKKGEGKNISGHPRYWSQVFAGQYYVTNNWWKAHHDHNAASLLRFVETLLDNRPSSPEIPSLQAHQTALKEFLGSARG